VSAGHRTQANRRPRAPDGHAPQPAAPVSPPVVPVTPSHPKSVGLPVPHGPAILSRVSLPSRNRLRRDVVGGWAAVQLFCTTSRLEPGLYAAVSSGTAY
jgi:hypothetical protein